MPNKENSPKNYRPDSGPICLRVLQDELGAVRIPLLGKEKPKTLQEQYPSIEFIDQELTVIRKRVSVSPTILDANNIHQLKRVTGIGYGASNLSNAELVSKFEDVFGVKVDKFTKSYQRHIEDELEKHGLVAKPGHTAFFAGDKIAVDHIEERMQNEAMAGSGATDRKIWEGKVQSDIELLKIAHVRTNGIEAIDSFLKKHELPSLGEFHAMDEAEVKAKLVHAGLDKATKEAAAEFIKIRFEDVTIAKVDFDKYARRVKDVVDLVATYGSNEKVTFKSSSTLDVIVGDVQVNGDDALRGEREKMSNAGFEIALDVRGGKRQEKKVDVIDDNSNTLVVGNIRRAKKHKFITTGVLATTAAVVAVGGFTFAKGGGSNGGEYGFDGSAEPTNTRTIGSTSNNDLEITQTVDARLVTQTAIRDEDATKTAVPTSTTENIGTRTASPTAISTAIATPENSVVIETPKVSGDQNQENAFDAMDTADGKADDLLSIEIGKNETFKDAVARTLGEVGITQMSDIEAYANFIQFQLDEDLRGAVEGESYILSADDLHGNAYVWREIGRDLTQKLTEKYEKEEVPVDRSVDIEWSDLVKEASKDLAKDINEFADKLGQDDNTSVGGSSDPKASVTVNALPVAGGGEYENDDYDHENTPEHDATRPPVTRTALPRTSTSVPATREAETATAIATSEPDVCIPIDLRGRLDYTGNHLSTNPVIGHLENHAENTSCDDSVYVQIFGSMQEPETDGWLESQDHVTSLEIDVPEGAADHTVSIDVPNEKYCWYQVDLVRTDEVRIPPYYQGEDMIDYVFVKDVDSCLPVTNTPTPSPTYTATVTSTHTPVPRTATFTPRPDKPTNVPTDTPEPTETPESTPTEVPTETPVPPTETPTVLVPQLPVTGSYEPQGYRVPSAALPIAAGVGAAAIAAGWYGSRRKNSDEDEEVTSKIAES